MKPVTSFKCADCSTEFDYATAVDGSVPDGCPDCESDNVEELEHNDP